MTSLTETERARYLRNLLVPGFGEDGQRRLREVRVLVVGVGGLGSPVALYLAASGVGVLGLADDGVVHVDNLQRQIVHVESRVGWKKIESAAVALAELNSDVQVVRHDCRLAPDNAAALVAEYDFVVEACDSFEAQFTINDVCLERGKAFVTAGVVGLGGHVMLVVPGRTPCLRCALPEPPDEGPTSQTHGILGAVAGVVGSLEALEALRWLAGLWTPQRDGAGLLHRLDGESMRLSTLRILRRPGCRCAEIRSEE
ncbi:MAG TPA: HesA/MoeB/ThiF family protein [Candidatus Hydrogenedentes bacterium]|nr:HesA/MoeB/ThiF family protein [Candidatus Hydrogenedentota bacterium]HPG69297.1 HesA/MoeB/ThiF family protein [Candidatus Hydrogenedentota bacterium]